MEIVAAVALPPPGKYAALEETAPAVGGQAGGEGGAAAKSTIVDHWMSAEEMALFEAVLKKVDDILKKNREAIQKLN